MRRRTPTSTLFPYTTLFRSPRPLGGAMGELTIRAHADIIFNMGLPRPARGENSGEFDVVPLQRSEEHTSELQSHSDLVCRLLLEKKKEKNMSKKLRE